MWEFLSSIWSGVRAVGTALATTILPIAHADNAQAANTATPQSDPQPTRVTAPVANAQPNVAATANTTTSPVRTRPLRTYILQGLATLGLVAGGMYFMNRAGFGIMSLIQRTGIAFDFVTVPLTRFGRNMGEWFARWFTRITGQFVWNTVQPLTQISSTTVFTGAGTVVAALYLIDVHSRDNEENARRVADSDIARQREAELNTRIQSLQKERDVMEAKEASRQGQQKALQHNVIGKQRTLAQVLKELDAVTKQRNDLLARSQPAVPPAQGTRNPERANGRLVNPGSHGVFAPPVQGVANSNNQQESIINSNHPPKRSNSSNSANPSAQQQPDANSDNTPSSPGNKK